MTSEHNSSHAADHHHVHQAESTHTAPELDATNHAVVYRERLNPAWWMWLLFVGFALSVLIALAPIAMWLGVTGAVLAVVICAAVAYTRATEIVVTDQDLQVGRARIERRFVGLVEPFTDAQEIRQVRGPQLDARAYMNFSASVGPICRIEITDPVDPTPYWLASTRRPHELADILNT
ncbi:DUF3093 domain-containing protein [Kocuria sp.]|uniref:DUF3093 domain-containing protein n=1 Tax=Kocuria sp. TaxID=1871328 RepID=UPI0026DECD58|nr:DUF3093 domain-containing protein [Kocuria sp.]MDO5619364.1 DUF3093 domain-containing protein [Kocuria sp.]